MTTQRATTVRMILALGTLAISAYAGVWAYAGIIAAGGNDHQAGDWLISYPGEFVRRGLFGDLLLRLTPAGQATLWALFAIQVALYVPIFGYVIDHLIRSRFSWSAIVLACSPAALPFIGWDPLGAFRKEILGFVALVLLALARRRLASWLRTSLIVASLLLWTLGVFSWEALVFLLPGVAFLLLADRELPWRWGLLTNYATIGVGAFFASVLVHGDATTPAKLCAPVVDHGLNATLCTGAIAWMGRGLDQSLQAVTQRLAVHSGYLVMLLLALLPIIVSPWLRRYWGWVVMCVIGIAPLFVLGIDYGRWIHILVIELAICMMASHLDLSESPLWNPASALLYISLWGMPHAAPTAPNLPGWPLRGLMSTLITWLQAGLLQIR